MASALCYAKKGSALNNHHIKVFVGYLGNLSKFIFKIEACVDGDTAILESRLIDDMFPLYTQAEIAVSFSLRASCPIANVKVASFSQNERSFSSLQSQLVQTIEYLLVLDEKLSDLSDCVITDMAGPIEVTLPASEFINSFALPNFFFHISMVYAIARANGIPATKGDFDGIHQYPVGFSFEE